MKTIGSLYRFKFRGEWREVPREIRLRTQAPLSGAFLAESGDHLVVRIAKGDIIGIRPAGSRLARELTVTVHELYRILLTRKATKEWSERMAQRRVALQAKRDARKIRLAERRLFRKDAA